MLNSLRLSRRGILTLKESSDLIGRGPLGEIIPNRPRPISLEDSPKGGICC